MPWGHGGAVVVVVAAVLVVVAAVLIREDGIEGPSYDLRDERGARGDHRGRDASLWEG